MCIKGISAITLAVENMTRAVEFYKQLGMEITYGGGDSFFTTFHVGEDAINLILAPGRRQDWWGRIILRVTAVDELHERLKKAGLEPEDPRDADWGERFFHIWDPDGNELSFAEVLTPR